MEPERIDMGTGVDHHIIMGDSTPRLTNTAARGAEDTWFAVPVALDVQAGDRLWFFDRAAEPGDQAKFAGMVYAVTSGEEGVRRGYCIVSMHMAEVMGVVEEGES